MGLFLISEWLGVNTSCFTENTSYNDHRYMCISKRANTSAPLLSLQNEQMMANTAEYIAMYL